MIKLIGKSLKIVETEIYNNRMLAAFANSCVFLLVLALQFGDITLKVTGNYLVLVWVAMNVCFTLHIFFRGNREFILCISRFRNYDRYLFLILLAAIINMQWFLVIFIQLVVCFKADVGNALLITLTQYLYAIAFGALAGVIQVKGVGVFLIGAFGLYNFIFCNPYNYEASSHMFMNSEIIFTVNDLNIESIINSLLFSIFFFILAFLGIKLSVKRRIKTVLLYVICFIVVYIVFLAGTIYTYENADIEQNMLYEQNERIEYRGLSDSEIKDVACIMILFEDEYNKIEGNLANENTYMIQKRYLPEMVWLINGGSISPIQILNDHVNVNILSRNMLYFEHSDLLRSFLEEVCVEMEANVQGYNSSKYTRHMINGFSKCILENVSGKLEIKSAKEVYDYYDEYHNEMLILPSTEYNFVKKIGYIVYSKYPDLANKLYISIWENEVSTDDEFIDLLKNDFGVIYEDSEVIDILSYIR